MKITPIYNQVLVHVINDDAQEYQSYKGIYIPIKAVNAFKRGTVMAVGCGKDMGNGIVIKPVCEVGQTVIFDHKTGEDIGNDLLIMADEHVLAVVCKE